MSVIKPTYKYVELTLRPWWKRFCLGIYIQGNWLSKRRNKRKAGPSCWLDGGRSECKLAVDCKKGAGFKQTKWLHQSREKFAVSPEDQIMTFWSLIQHSNIKRGKREWVNCSITINCINVKLRKDLFSLLHSHINSWPEKKIDHRRRNVQKWVCLGGFSWNPFLMLVKVWPGYCIFKISII